jgi:hypothetical protein
MVGVRRAGVSEVAEEYNGRQRSNTIVVSFGLSIAKPSKRPHASAINLIVRGLSGFL